jgi:hypothetical protein
VNNAIVKIHVWPLAKGSTAILTLEPPFAQVDSAIVKVQLVLSDIRLIALFALELLAMCMDFPTVV